MDPLRVRRWGRWRFLHLLMGSLTPCRNDLMSDTITHSYVCFSDVQRRRKPPPNLPDLQLWVTPAEWGVIRGGRVSLSFLFLTFPASLLKAGVWKCRLFFPFLSSSFSLFVCICCLAFIHSFICLFIYLCSRARACAEERGKRLNLFKQTRGGALKCKCAFQARWAEMSITISAHLSSCTPTLFTLASQVSGREGGFLFCLIFFTVLNKKLN